MRKSIGKRLLSSILAFVLVLSCMPAPVFAAVEDGQCEHHTQHTEDCGYRAAVAGHECGHEHGDDCYKWVTVCVHVHGDCSYVEAVEGHGCECQPDENGEIVHTEGCGYVEAVAEVPCEHVCSEEAGCITLELNCTHVHDENCGYVEASDEIPCSFVCEECAKKADKDEIPPETTEAPAESNPNVKDPEEESPVRVVFRGTPEGLTVWVYPEGSDVDDAFEAEEDGSYLLLPGVYGYTAAATGYTTLEGTFRVEQEELLLNIILEEASSENQSDSQDDSGASGEETPPETTEAPAESNPNVKDPEEENPVRVVFRGTPEDLTVWVYPEGSDVDDAFEAEEDGSYLLLPGTYGYTAAAVGYTILEETFQVEQQELLLNITLEEATLENQPDPLSDNGTCGKNLTWVLSDDGVLTISGTGDMADYTIGEAPWDGKKWDITTVVINSGVTSIGDFGFTACDMTKITIPASVSSIGKCAFYGCRSLTEINIPAGVTSIGWGAFYDCISLTDVTIPASVTSIGGNAFSGCSSLSKITIPEGVTNIGEDAFSGCSSLNEITIPEGVTSIMGHVFYNCSSLSEITLPESVISIGSGAFSYCSSLTEIKIPAGVTSIGDHAFCDCSSLTGITIPAGVTSIDAYAFYDCISLINVTIPSSVTSIGEMAFYNCSSLTKIKIPAGVTSIDWGVFYDCSSLTEITIPESVTSIAEQAFYGCSSLKSITIPKGVTRIRTNTFMNCFSLESITIPESVTVIDGGAFTDCYSLESITIPESVTTVAAEAFDHCTGLTEFTFPKGVTHIGNSVFACCSNLKKITFLGDAPEFAEDSFEGITALARYPRNNATWTESARQNYGGTLTWITECSEEEGHTFGEWVVTTPATPEAEGAETRTCSRCLCEETRTIPRVVLDTPVLSSVSNTSTGVKVTWNAVPGAVNYQVMKKTGSGSWTQVGYTSATSITATGLTSGTTYTFTVRCVSTDGKTKLSSYSYTGKSITYIAQPAISSVANTSTGVKVTWNAVPGAVNYQVMKKTGSGSWTQVGYTSATSITATGFTSGTTYTFTVRCVSTDGKTKLSSYSYTGKSITYIAQPAISSVANTSTGVKVTWDAVPGAVNYQVMKKTGSGDWTQVGYTSATSIIDTDLTSGTTYTFTVRCVSTDGKTKLSSYSYTGKSITYIAQPAISSVANTSSGVKVTWDAVPGAAKYRVYKRIGSGSWSTVGDTTSTSITATGLTSGTTYTFTVCCVSADGKLDTSSYDSTGMTITYIAQPVISSVANTSTGVKVTWNTVPGAVNYQVMKKTGSGSWTQVGYTSATSITATGLTSGTTYTFTVRCVSTDGKTKLSSYSYTGKSITYIAQPAISSVANTSTGVKVTWNTVPGAVNYQVMKKTGSGDWTQVGYTTSTSITDTDLTSGTTYTFTVRCVSTDGKTKLSSYSYTGKSITYIAQPTISSVANTSAGVKVTWNTVPGAVNYQVMKKTGSGDWTQVGYTTSTSITDTDLTSGTTYTFTVRCVSTDGKTKLSSYSYTGKSITYIAQPTISSVANTSTGVKVTWNTVPGAVNYQVMKKTGSGDWTQVGYTSATSITATGLTSGTTYTFTVRCVSADGKTKLSSYSYTGKSITYIAQPTISSVVNTSTGVKITWDAVPGAVNYQVMKKTGSGSWTQVGYTSATSITATGLTSGTTYTFTVRCVSADGKTKLSSYSTTGKSITVQ